MNMNKKAHYSFIIRTLAVFLGLTLLFSIFLTNYSRADETKIRIVTTIFPVYDWVRQILGDDIEHAEVIMLLDSGADLHNFQPTAADILKIKQADVFVYIGGESDHWVENVLTVAENPARVTINLMEALGENLREEEIVEGMETSKENDHQDDDEEEEKEYDEHIWLSLRNAGILVQVIASKMSEADPGYGDSYIKRAQGYTEELSKLDASYEEAVVNGTRKVLLFADRFPFRYLTDDYGLTYYAAFSGCSAESEASFETVMFLARKIDELELPVVLTIENPRTDLADTVIRSTKSGNQQVVSLNSMQSITADDLESGITYLSVMTQNLDALKQALK